MKYETPRTSGARRETGDGRRQRAMTSAGIRLGLAPATEPQIILLQRAIGNAAVLRLLSAPLSVQRITGGHPPDTRVFHSKAGRWARIVKDVPDASEYQISYEDAEESTVSVAYGDLELTEKEEGETKGEGIGGKGEKDHDSKFQGALRSAAATILAESAFEADDEDKTFNEKFWELKKEKDEEGDVEVYLRLREGESVVDAINDLVNNAAAYTFDCASFIQAVELYAWKAADLAAVQELKAFEFREHNSTGISHEVIYYRNRRRGRFYERTQETDEKDLEEKPVASMPDALRLANAPVGSRVAFKNYDRRAKATNWERENSVKLDLDVYGAHPLGSGSAQEIMEGLASQAIAMYLDDGVEEKVFSEEASKELEGIEDIVDRARWTLRHKDEIPTAKKRLAGIETLEDYVSQFIELSEIEIYEVISRRQ